MEYGLIGGRLGHSYSKPIHEELGGYDYRLCPLPTPEEAHAFLRARDFKAINVTIPYKELVLPYCDEIDDAARAIGSVNTLVNKNGRLEGHNTDFAGFTWMLRKNGICLKNKTVMLLGTGGTQKTALAVARAEGAAEVILVSRRHSEKAISYEEAAARRDVQVLVNTSPVGMYPENGACLVDLEHYPNLEAVLDVIYNPFRGRIFYGQADPGRRDRPHRQGAAQAAFKPCAHRHARLRQNEHWQTVRAAAGQALCGYGRRFGGAHRRAHLRHSLAGQRKAVPRFRERRGKGSGQGKRPGNRHGRRRSAAGRKYPRAAAKRRDRLSFPPAEGAGSGRRPAALAERRGRGKAVRNARAAVCGGLRGACGKYRHGGRSRAGRKGEI